jgi:hypothetical protein
MGDLTKRDDAPDLEMCGKCMGSGYGGHPDSGALCVDCNGTGGVADRIEQLVKERDGYLAERNKFQLYLQRTHADWELEVAAVGAINAKLAKAVEALREIAGKVPYSDNPWDVAFNALAELEGH